jgi:hypothetical protein
MILKGLKPIARHRWEFVIPDRNTRRKYDFNANANDLSYGFKSDAWLLFYPLYSKPQFQMTTCHNTTRRIYSEELYPLTDIAGTITSYKYAGFKLLSF